VSEELRFFLRTALYTALIGVIYWFVSYEWVGTALLMALLIGALSFVVVMAAMVPRTRQMEPDGTSAPEEPLAPEGPGPQTPTHGAPTPISASRFGRAATAARRVVGFEDHPDDEVGGPMELEDEVFPTASIWPLALAVGATLLGVGLIFGPWLWVPGAGLFVASGLAWLTQLR
jgi:hypothetical protein